MEDFTCYECDTPIAANERHYSEFTELPHLGGQRTVRHIHGVCLEFRRMIGCHFLDDKAIKDGRAMEFWTEIIRPSTRAAPLASPEMYALARNLAGIIQAKKAKSTEVKQWQAPDSKLHLRTSSKTKAKVLSK